MTGFPHLPEAPASTPEPTDLADQLSQLNIQLHQARAVAAMLGATSRSADIDHTDVLWAADCVATLLDDALSRVTRLGKRGATS